MAVASQVPLIAGMLGASIPHAVDQPLGQMAQRFSKVRVGEDLAQGGRTGEDLDERRGVEAFENVGEFDEDGELRGWALLRREGPCSVDCSSGRRLDPA